MKLNSIQYLRAIAATAVVVSHASTSLFDRERALIPFEVGGAGIDLFFVISGFIMFYTTDNKALSPQEFWLRRLVRVAPLYFMLSTLAFLLAFSSPKSFNTFSPDPLYYIRSVLFIPFFNQKVHDIRPEIGQGWTLNYEMFFYVIFSVALFFKRTQRIFFAFLIFSVLIFIGVMFNSSSPIFIVYTDPIMMEFFFGMIIAYFMDTKSVVSHRNVCAIVLVLLLIASIYLQVFQPNLILPRFVSAGIPAAAVIAVGLWLEGRGKIPEWPVLLLVGDASYSLYLAHGFVLGVLRRIWQRLFDISLVATHAEFMAAASIFSILVAILIFRFVERPVTRLLTSRLEPRSA